MAARSHAYALRPTALSAATRARDLERMAREQWDVLVVGGGITGAGVALDAALRGLRVALVERDDFASGTSSKSSKMVHGGLRYLETGNVPLVRESLVERKGLQRRAPHLVHPLPILYPLYPSRFGHAKHKLSLGMWAYDILGAGHAGRRHVYTKPAEIARRTTSLDMTDVVGGFLYRDAAVDDARLVASVMRQAAEYGAAIANYTRAERLVESAAGRVTGAQIVPDGAEGFELSASVVVNATGVWADRLFDGLMGAESPFTVVPSKGIHVVFSGEQFDFPRMVSFHGFTGTNVFIEPWGNDDLWVLGTTDVKDFGELRHPHATDAEVAALIELVNPLLARPLAMSDVVASWAGHRPLAVQAGVDPHAASSSDMSRSHHVSATPGLVTVTGGKLTTYRRMAQDALDEAVKQLPSIVHAGRCVTARTPLIGATDDVPRLERDVADSFGGDAQLARHLVRRYGTDARWIADMCAAEPDLRNPLHPDRPHIVAEARFAARHELALRAGDTIERRTRIALETSDAGRAARDAVEAQLAHVGVEAWHPGTNDERESGDADEMEMQA